MTAPVDRETCRQLRISQIMPYSGDTLVKSLLLTLVSLVLIGFSPASALQAHENDTAHPLEIADVWARKTRRTMSAAVYLSIHNATGKPDTLLSAQTERAAMATLHLSGEQDGVMRMEMQDSVPIPAGETVLFEPGGLHIMLMQLTEPLEEGSVFPLTLAFEQAGEVTVYVDVTGLAGRAGH